MAAKEAGFNVLVTTDKNLSYQRNLTGRKIAVRVLSQQQWPALRLHVVLVAAAVLCHSRHLRRDRNSFRLTLQVPPCQPAYNS